MEKRFLKKIIAQNGDDLRVISALTSGSKVKQENIKYLKKNKIFLLPISRNVKDANRNNKKINAKTISNFNSERSSNSFKSSTCLYIPYANKITKDQCNHFAREL